MGAWIGYWNVLSIPLGGGGWGGLGDTARWEGTARVFEGGVFRWPFGPYLVGAGVRPFDRGQAGPPRGPCPASRRTRRCRRSVSRPKPFSRFPFHERIKELRWGGVSQQPLPSHSPARSLYIRRLEPLPPWGGGVIQNGPGVDRPPRVRPRGRRRPVCPHRPHHGIRENPG